MNEKDAEQILSYQFLRLQNYHDVSSQYFLQDLVVHLTAKEVLEERRKEGMNSNSIAGLLNSFVESSLNHEVVLLRYLSAAEKLMPAYYNQFSISDIYDSVSGLLNYENGLNECYAFLHENASVNSNLALYTFISSVQKNNILSEGQVTKSESFKVPQKLDLIKLDDDYVLQFTNLTTNEVKKLEGLNLTTESVGSIFFNNETLKIQINREDIFLSNAISSVYIIAKNKKWVIEYK